MMWVPAAHTSDCHRGDPAADEYLWSWLRLEGLEGPEDPVGWVHKQVELLRKDEEAPDWAQDWLRVTVEPPPCFPIASDVVRHSSMTGAC